MAKHGSKDPVLEELRRSSSLSSATSFRTGMSSVSDYDSTLSLEALGASDIGKVLLTYPPCCCMCVCKCVPIT